MYIGISYGYDMYLSKKYFILCIKIGSSKCLFINIDNVPKLIILTSVYFKSVLVIQNPINLEPKATGCI